MHITDVHDLVWVWLLGTGLAFEAVKRRKNGARHTVDHEKVKLDESIGRAKRKGKNPDHE